MKGRLWGQGSQWQVGCREREGRQVGGGDIERSEGYARSEGEGGVRMVGVVKERIKMGR